MEKSPEIGSGHNTTYFRELDSRTGRWWSTDPVWHPWQSNYTTFDDNPVALSDPSGAATGRRGGSLGRALAAVGNYILTSAENNNMQMENCEAYHYPNENAIKAAEKGFRDVRRDTFKDGRRLWELEPYEQDLLSKAWQDDWEGQYAAAELERLDLVDFWWTWEERAYALGHMLGLASPTGKMGMVGKASKGINGTTKGSKSVGPVGSYFAQANKLLLGCFIAGTKVMAIDSLINIEDLEVGDMVVVSLEHTEDAITNLLASSDARVAINETAITSEKWRKIDLEIEKENGTKVAMELLRPVWWIDTYIESEGDELYITLPELGIDGMAKVIKLDTTTIQLKSDSLNYRVVIGKFIHISNMVWELTFEGMDKPLGVTSNHPIWSADKNKWVDAGNLTVGEKVNTKDGTARLLSKQYLLGEHKVYNIEVHDAHNYFVENGEILVHNTGPCEEVFVMANKSGAGGTVEILVDGNLKRVGSYVYDSKSKSLAFDLDIPKDLQGTGIASTAYKEVMKLHDVAIYNGTYIDVNYKVFKQALDNKMTVSQAIREIPSVKALMRSGEQWRIMDHTIFHSPAGEFISVKFEKIK